MIGDEVETSTRFAIKSQDSSAAARTWVRLGVVVRSNSSSTLWCVSKLGACLSVSWRVPYARQPPKAQDLRQRSKDI